MYSSVRRLEADGDIEWYWGDGSQGERRKYFRITEKSKATYAGNKNYLAMKTICFDGAIMDKLTYAALKGLWVVDLSKVTVI